jgi:MFS family permease
MTRSTRFGILLCTLCATVDGMDAQAMALAAPMIARNWDVPAMALGLALSAAPLGMAAGAASIGPLSDRIGRKAALILSLLWLGIFSLLLATAPSIDVLAAMRLLAGIGMGGVVVTVMALAGDLSPSESRPTNVAIVFTGVPLGGLLSAVVAVAMPESAGWRGLFLLFGSFPIMLAPVVAKWLEEGSRPATAEQAAKIPLSRLFEGSHRWRTPILWIGIAIAYQVTYFLVLWLPALLERAGLPLKTSMATLIALNAGAIVGGLGLAALMRRFPARGVVLATFAIASVSAAAAAANTGQVWLLLAMLFFLGLLSLGGQMVLGGLVAELYPADIRGAGIGWATGVGRLGAVSGPLVGAEFVSLGWGAAGIMILIAVLQIIVALCLMLGTGATQASAHEQ